MNVNSARTMKSAGFFHKERLSRVGKLDALQREPFEYLEVDFLLYVHIGIVVRAEDKIDHFDIQTEIRELFEMRAVKPRLVDALDNLFDDPRRPFHFFETGLINESQSKQNAAKLHPFIIPDSAGCKIRVGED